MSELQLYVYLSGFLAFFLSCFFYYQSTKDHLSDEQKLIRKKGMYFFSIIAFICVVYSWL
jgi:hypothetical protein